MSDKVEVVYNACFGGFGLSADAVRLGRELSGDPRWAGCLLVGERFDDGGVYEGFGERQDATHHDSDFPRHDKTLISVVKRLGEKANGMCAKLRVATLDGRRYRIYEYDGSESVVEPNDGEWTVVP